MNAKEEWGQLELAGIQEGVMHMLSSISNGLTIVGFIVSTFAFLVYLVIKYIDTVLPRLLGVIKFNIIFIIRL